MNKFYMNGKLIHKASDHNTKRCEVEKWVFLPHSDFERLKANPYQEHEAITAARDLMYEDKNAYHCIMLLDEYGDDGLLIEAEGFDYPRFFGFAVGFCRGAAFACWAGTAAPKAPRAATKTREINDKRTFSMTSSSRFHTWQSGSPLAHPSAHCGSG